MTELLSNATVISCSCHLSTEAQTCFSTMSWAFSPQMESTSEFSRLLQTLSAENGTILNIEADPSKLDIYLGYTYFVLTAITSLLSIMGCIVIVLSYILIKVSILDVMLHFHFIIFNELPRGCKAYDHNKFIVDRLSSQTLDSSSNATKWKTCVSNASSPWFPLKC